MRYFAQPFTLPDDTYDIMRWSIGFPGVKGTAWENGYFRAFLKFGNNFPTVPPECRFGERIFHPNICVNGIFTTPYLSSEWDSEFRIETIINIVRDILHTPNIRTPRQPEPLIEFVMNRKEFYKSVRRDAEMRAYNVVMSPF